MPNVAIFLDGAYVEKVFVYDHNRPKVDFSKLVHAIAAPDELLRTYYYHCLPYKSNPPTIEESTRFASRQRFYDKLGTIPRFQVRLGKLVYRGTDVNGGKIFIQKKVDIMVGVDMVTLAAKGKIARVVLFSGDSDLIPAVEAVKGEGVVVTLWHGSFGEHTSPSQDLYQICDERKLLSADVIAGCLLP